MAENLGQSYGILWWSRPGNSSYLIRRHVGIEENYSVAGVIEKKSPNYLYLALCVYQLIEAEGGWRWECCYVCVTVELVSSLYSTVHCTVQY
jgi:hypothetical protein